MKIAIVTHDLCIKGGTHKQVLRLCQYLSNQGNVELILVTKYLDLTKTYNEFSAYDIRYLYKNFPDCKKEKKKNYFPDIRWHIKELEKDIAFYNLIPKDVDIINVHDCGVERIIKWGKRDGKKVIWQVNDLPYCFNVGVSSGESDSLRKAKARFLAKYRTEDVDVITVNVSKNAERVKKCFGKDARVLYCGVDSNETLEKHSYHSVGKQFRLLSMGVFFPYRNYETLIEVIKQLISENINVRLDIMGSTELNKEYSAKIINLIDNNKLNENIKIWGQTSDKEYNQLFNQANAFAFVNIEQSWGLAVFEAMSAGLPSVVSNSVGAVELLHNGKDSIIVNPKNVDEICNVLKKLMTDSNYYNRIADEACRVVKEFTWDKMYSSKMFKIFEELEKR